MKLIREILCTTLLLISAFSAQALANTAPTIAQVKGEFASDKDANALTHALAKSFGSEVKFSYPGENPAAGDGANFDHTGWAVAVAGDTALVGVPLDTIGANEFQGTVYVYLRSGSSWSQQAKLKASDGAIGDEFGFSVALSGDTAVIGAIAGNFGRGAAYVFTRSANVWTQQAKLVASDAGGNDRFGWSVALDGDRAVVGANQDDLVNSNQGSTYVFSRSGNVWSQQSKLSAADGALDDEFGYAVAVSGTTVLVGARSNNTGTGNAYAFTFAAGSWTQQAKITATDAVLGDQFGWTVALEGDTALIGAPGDDIASALEQGSAYVFVRAGVIWTQQAKLVAADGAGNDQFGWKVALSGETALVGAHFDSVGAATKQGSAYAFVRSVAVWSQQAKIVAADGLRNDEFGYGLALRSDTAIIGAPFDDVGGNTDQGSAYAFTRSGTAWAQQNQFSTGAGSSDQQFALAIAVSGDTAMAGARFETVGSKLRQGAVYVYTRNANVWTQSARLVASDGDVGDTFGNDVAINGDTAVIGASGDTLGSSTLQGSAYVFSRSGGTWSQQSKLIAADGSSGMEFGRVVAVDADTVLIGAPSARIGTNFNQGAAYVYTRSAGSWGLQSKLTASDGEAGDYLGLAVALSSDNALVASSYDDIAGNSDQGSVYAFSRSGVSWSAQDKLIAADGAAGDYFGIAVAMSGDTAVVGAFLDDIGVNANQGSAYVYTRSAGSWSLQSKLVANDGVANDSFGLGIALDGNIAVIGARQRDNASNSDQGAAYVYTRSANSWNQQRRFTGGDGEVRDYYGYSVAISGDAIAVGAYAVDSVLPFGNQDIGALYLYRNDYSVTPLAGANGAISPAAPQNVAPNQVLTFNVTPSVGFSVSSVSGCGGSWSGNNPYVTAPIVSDCTINATFAPPGAGLEVGAITLPATGIGANSATRVNFAQVYPRAPVVIVQMPNGDSDPQALRIANVSSTGFDLLQVEAPGCIGCTGAAGAVNVHWLAALSGAYRLATADGTGVLVKVGTISTSASQRATTAGRFAGWAAPSWQTVSFPTLASFDFATAPVLLSTIQTWSAANEGSNLTLSPMPMLTGASQIWLTPAVRNVTASGFDTALDSSGVDDNSGNGVGLVAPETIGYIAIDRGVSARLARTGSAVIGLASGPIASVGAACAESVNLSFPSGTGANAINLRGFVGLESRNNDAGGWLRRCSLSNPIGTTVVIGARVEKDLDLGAFRGTSAPDAAGTAVFGGDFITTPISLAFVNTTRSGTQLNVQFGIATETGHLGYRIWGRRDKAQDWRALHDDLILNRNGDSMSAKSYQRTVEAAGITEIRLEDVDLTGASRFHAEIKLGANGAAATGAPALDQPLNWTAIRASNSANPPRAMRGSGATSVLASVRKTGIQRVSYSDLIAVGFPTAVPVSEVAVLENNLPVARHIECSNATFASGCSVEWLGQIRPILYGSERIYQISQNPAAVQAVSRGAVVSNATAPRSFTTEVSQFPNRSYSFSAPGNDPWFDQRLAANTAPVSLTRSFSLPAKVTGPVQLSVDLWGGLDFSGAQNPAPDHSVELLLNGSSIARERFDGLVLKRINLNLSDAQLQPVNTLTVRVLADTGYAADVVLLDGFKVSYTRSSSVNDGELLLGEFDLSQASDTLLSDGFEARSGFAIQGVNSPSIVWSQQNGRHLRDTINGNVALDNRTSALQLSTLAQIQTPALSAAGVATIDLAPVDYLIVTHPLFEAELQPIITLQQSRGYSVKVLRTDAIYAAKSAHQRSPQAIREVIAQINPKFVLLIGGDSYDYDDNLNIGSHSYLPTFYRVSNAIVRFAASDAPFVDSNGDGKPERALGRIPARTVEELRRAISAIVQRGNTPAANYFAAAGSSSASEHFDVHSRAMLSYLRQGQPVAFGLSDEIGVLEARSKTTAALAGGSDFINYLGHSSPNRWAAQNLLDTTQLGSIQRSGLPAIVAQWGCWNNYFVLPNQDTMSHALMLRSNQLAAAVIGSTSLAEDASHLALGTRFFDLLEDGRIDDQSGSAVNTLGEALYRAKLDLARGAPEHMESNYSISLFGDPAMLIR